MPTIPSSELLSSSRHTLRPRDPTDPSADLGSTAHRIHQRLPESRPDAYLPLSPAEAANRKPVLKPLQPLHDLPQQALSRRALRTNVIPLSYNTAGPNPGTTVGIVLGSIAGFLVLFGLIWFATTGRRSGMIEGDDITDIHVSRRSHSPSRSRRTRRTRTARSEMTERSEPEPVRSPPRPRRSERIIVEETRRTERSQPPPAPASVSSPAVERERESIYEREETRERRVEGDDVVEVIEEHSELSSEPPKRKKSGFRTVDPNAYGGGNYPQREVDRDRRKSSRRD